MKLSPSDLDKNLSLENLKKINIDMLVRKVNKDLKRSLLEAQIETNYGKVGLTTSRTRFNGVKYWFSCPSCAKRAGVLYLSVGDPVMKCRRCIQLLYFKQKFKRG